MKKKGFTIVECVIAIAVIGILAAVLIPIFSGLVSKSNESQVLQDKRNRDKLFATEYYSKTGTSYQDHMNMKQITPVEFGWEKPIDSGSALSSTLGSVIDVHPRYLGKSDNIEFEVNQCLELVIPINKDYKEDNVVEKLDQCWLLKSDNSFVKEGGVQADIVKESIQFESFEYNGMLYARISINKDDLSSDWISEVKYMTIVYKSDYDDYGLMKYDVKNCTAYILSN